MDYKVFILAVFVFSGGCASSGEKEVTFLENDIERLVQEADDHLESEEYQNALKKYQNALIDFRVLISGVEDKRVLNSYILDTLGIHNKMEIARIGTIIK